MTLGYTNVGTIIDKCQSNPTYIVASSLDTTASVQGPLIDNRDGKISYMAAQFVATGHTGTTPTLQLTLVGSNDGVTFFTVLDDAGSAVQTSATSIGSAAPSTPSTAGLTTSGLKTTNFPAMLGWQVAVGGSASPGGNYVVSTTTIRDKYSTARF